MIAKLKGILLGLSVLIGLGPEGQTGPANPAGKWCLIFSNPDDTGRVVEEGQPPRIEIRSPKGIGKAKVICPGTWPSGLTLRLYLAGLEHLRISSDKISLELSVQSYEPFDRFVRVTNTPEDLSPPGHQKPGDPLWVEIQARDAAEKPCRGLPPKGGFWEIILPPAFLKAAGAEIELRWIDFYR
jgi:hypothetical protein